MENVRNGVFEFDEEAFGGDYFRCRSTTI